MKQDSDPNEQRNLDLKNQELRQHQEEASSYGMDSIQMGQIESARSALEGFLALPEPNSDEIEYIRATRVIAKKLVAMMKQEGLRLSLAESEYFKDLVTNEKYTELHLFLEGEELTLTPQTLINVVSPYLVAVRDIQKYINEISQQPTREVKITSITQYSPISVSLDGAAEAVQIVQNTVIPWRRKHSEVMAQLAEQDKLADIEYKKAEVLEKRASAGKNRAEADKLVAEAAAKREEATKMKLENEKLHIELQRAKIQLVLEILNQLSPNIAETERIAYLVKLLPPLDLVIASNLEIVTDTPNKGAA